MFLPLPRPVVAAFERLATRRTEARRATEAARLDEIHERRIEDAERAHLAPSHSAEPFPAVTAALALVALAAAQHEVVRVDSVAREPEFARGAAAGV